MAIHRLLPCSIVLVILAIKVSVRRAPWWIISLLRSTCRTLSRKKFDRKGWGLTWTPPNMIGYTGGLCISMLLRAIGSSGFVMMKRSGKRVYSSRDRPQSKTLASRVFHPAQGAMHIAFGNGCKIPCERYVFSTTAPLSYRESVLCD